MEGTAVLEEIGVENMIRLQWGLLSSMCQQCLNSKWKGWVFQKEIGICDQLFSYYFLLILLRGLCSFLTQIINHTMKTNQITLLISRLINMKTFIDDFYVH